MLPARLQSYLELVLKHLLYIAASVLIAGLSIILAFSLRHYRAKVDALQTAHNAVVERNVELSQQYRAISDSYRQLQQQNETLQQENQQLRVQNRKQAKNSEDAALAGFLFGLGSAMR